MNKQKLIDKLKADITHIEKLLQHIPLYVTDFVAIRMEANKYLLNNLIIDIEYGLFDE